jgi:CBS domain-containing membrane protein
VSTDALQPETRVVDIMTRPVLTVELGESLWDAWQLMFIAGLRHLVVLDDDGLPVGVLTDRAVLADTPPTEEHLGTRFVRDVQARVPRTSINLESRAHEAAHAMSHHSVEALPVTESDGRLVGIVTESDVVRWIGAAA